MPVIYVYLLDEGTDVWRPVQAERISDDIFVIDPKAQVPDDELWSFRPGQSVRCRWRKFSDGEGFEAIEELDNPHNAADRPRDGMMDSRAGRAAGR